MSLDFSPALSPAAPARRIRAHALTEARLVLGNGEQALLALVIPAAILIGTRFFGHRFGQDLAGVTPSVLALALWSTAFTSLAITTGFERRYNVLERLAATPLGRTGILLGKAWAFALIALGQLAVLGLLALGLGWRPSVDPLHVLVALLSGVLAVAAFAGGALALSGSVRAEVTLGLANLVYLVGLVLGIMVPLAALPTPAGAVVAALPTGALGEAFRDGDAWSIPVLAVWAVLTLLLARKVFRWTS